LVDHFVFHNFDSFGGAIETSEKINPRNKPGSTETQNKINALYASAEGDLTELRRLLCLGVSVCFKIISGQHV
jgi:hypothetical protein